MVRIDQGQDPLLPGIDQQEDDIPWFQIGYTCIGPMDPSPVPLPVPDPCQVPFIALVQLSVVPDLFEQPAVFRTSFQGDQAAPVFMKPVIGSRFQLWLTEIAQGPTGG